jgi:hypothetical protein
MSARPNFLYIGSSKSGSTWIFKTLSWHPQIYMYPGKNLGFFSSRFEKGWDWYIGNFRPGAQHKIIGDVSHSYLVSEDAAARIREHLPDAKMMVCLRDPVKRTFSDYLDGIKNGKIDGSLEEELERTPALITRSRYGTHLSRYLERFDRDQIHIASFDELVSNPDAFTARLFEFLGVDALELPPKLKEKVLPAGSPRSRALATGSKRLSQLMRAWGLNGLRGKLKTSRSVRNLIYKPLSQDKRPTMSSQTEQRLREMMAEEVQLLDRLAGTDFCKLWNYPSAN